LHSFAIAVENSYCFLCHRWQLRLPDQWYSNVRIAGVYCRWREYIWAVHWGTYVYCVCCV